MENFRPKQKRAFPYFCACALILSLMQFLFFYIPNGFFYESAALIFISSYIINFVEALLPPLAAMIIFLSREVGIKNKILPCIFVSLTRLFYSFPYYYVYYVSDVFNSAESIMLSLILSLVFVLFFFLQTFICILIMNYIEMRSNKNSSDRKPAKLFNFEDHVNFGIVLSVLFVFVIFFIRECINTVQYLTENSGSYRTEEILTVVLSYLIIFIFSFINYIIAVSIKNKII